MEVKSKSCLSKCGISGIDYTINPYVGCQHGCKYCYADFIKRFRNIKDEWGNFIYIKSNCLDFLEKELIKNKKGHIWMSSVCDCYMHIEKEYELTRNILKKILEFKDKFSLEIITKSKLVERDFDLLKNLNFELGMSINNLNERTAKIIEPLASSPRERINTLKKAKSQGLEIFGFVSPVMPGITNLEELFRELNFCNYVFIELLNTKPSVLGKLIPVYKKYFPDRLNDLNYAINYPEKYFKEIKGDVNRLSKKYNLEVKGIVRH